jgi:hypothetical protein
MHYSFLIILGFVLVLVGWAHATVIAGPVVGGLKEGSFSIYDSACGKISVILTGTTVLTASDVTLTIGTRVNASFSGGCSASGNIAEFLALNSAALSLSGVVSSGLANGKFLLVDSTGRCPSSANVSVTLDSNSVFISNDTTISKGVSVAVTGTGSCTSIAAATVRLSGATVVKAEQPSSSAPPSTRHHFSSAALIATVVVAAAVLAAGLIVVLLVVRQKKYSSIDHRSLLQEGERN